MPPARPPARNAEANAPLPVSDTTTWRNCVDSRTSRASINSAPPVPRPVMTWTINFRSSAASVRSAKACTENRATISSRQHCPNSGDKRPASSKQARAKASASPRGTTMPVWPMMVAESPTSVATQGTPQAMASANTLGKPSPNREASTAISKAAIKPSISVSASSSCTGGGADTPAPATTN